MNIQEYQQYQLWRRMHVALVKFMYKYLFRNKVGNVSSTKLPPQPASDPLYFKSLENGSTILIYILSEYVAQYSFEYSIDEMETWTHYVPNTTITVDSDNKIYFRATATNTSFEGKVKFIMSGKFYANGNILYLIDKTGKNMEVSAYGYYGLFLGCEALIHPPVLPATILGQDCYNSMFSKCYNLETAPALPATTLAIGCYDSMFYMNEDGKLNLVMLQLPELPAKNLPLRCYANMFNKCTGLTKAVITGELFDNPGHGTNGACYQMFAHCYNLNEVEVHFKDSNTWKVDFIRVYNTLSWLDNVKSTGTFKRSVDTPKPNNRGSSTVPANWTVLPEWT